MRHYFVAIFALFILCACSSQNRYADLQIALDEYVVGKDAEIGLAVIIDGKDTVSVNGDKAFPMLSVYKFPIALALADEYRNCGKTFDFPLPILPEDLHLDTWSPMTEKILASSVATPDTMKLPARELLRYMLQLSDNNASDIVLKSVGGAKEIQKYMNKIGVRGIDVLNSEAEMHIDNSLCYSNFSTPIAMASLMDKFDNEFNDPLTIEIKRLMETCETGGNRLSKPMAGTNAIIGHKTGTGFTLPDGRLMAVNDAGYVHLPNGHRYTIAVFIENSGYDMETTEALIAEISRLIFINVID